jgi:hypothetical protein
MATAVVLATSGGDHKSSGGTDVTIPSVPPPPPPPEAPPPAPPPSDFPSTPAEEQLYNTVPQTDCSHADPASEADAAIVCEISGGRNVLYESFADNDSMYTVYDRLVSRADAQQAFDSDCPQDAPSNTEWADGAKVTRGRWVCYLTEGETDAHVLWTQDDVNILSALSYDGVGSDFGPLLAYWRATDPLAA